MEMKIANYLKGLVLGLSLLLAVSAFAANKGSVQLMDSVNVSGTQLKAGDYSLKWEGTGQNVQLSILKGNKVVATTPARLVDLNESSRGDVAVVNTNADGSKSLSEIRFGGKKYALEIGQESASSGAAK
jgi:hypothetical protein